MSVGSRSHVVSSFTVIKGANSAASLPTAFMQNADSTYNFTYSLDASHPGILFNIPLSAPVSAAPLDSLLFQGFDTGWFTGSGVGGQVPSYGIVTAWRRL